MASYKHAKKTIIEMYNYWKENAMSFHEFKALEKSIEALDKQIPKAIEYNNDNLSICPCGLHVHTYDKYCKHCGQAIYYDINKE